MSKIDIYITTSPERKYFEDLNFLTKITQEYLNIYVIVLEKDIFEERYMFQTMRVKSIKNLQKLSESGKVVIRYGRYFFNYIPFFFVKNKIILHSDGGGYIIGTKNFNFDIIEKKRYSFGEILLQYIRFYGFRNTIFMLCKSWFFHVNVDTYGIHKNFGILELSRLYFQNHERMKKNTKKQILIIEQPFLKNLSSEKEKLLFSFIDNFCEMNIDYNIVFKIHPRSDDKFYKRNIKAKNIEYEKGDILNYIKVSEYIVGFFSTVLFTSLLFEKKVIVIDPINLFKDIEKIKLLKYRNTGYMLSPKKIESVNVSKQGEDIKKLLFDFDAFRDYIAQIGTGNT